MEESIVICQQAFEVGISADPYCDHSEISKMDLKLVTPSGAIIKRTETELPFHVYGDNGGDVFGKSLTVGSYTLSGQAYGRGVGSNDPYIPYSYLTFVFSFQVKVCPTPFEAPL